MSQLPLLQTAVKTIFLGTHARQALICLLAPCPSPVALPLVKKKKKLAAWLHGSLGTGKSGAAGQLPFTRRTRRAAAPGSLSDKVKLAGEALLPRQSSC